ncbi:hypothetical protein SUGI_0423150 [Cryptomeria japonica]|uniref:F-box/kelch-repeat protein At5g15710 n=1 Tax=Cryptomeria japonica TaxID=3369 RepID=UPI002408C57F|nr:F-box/kelch-repeat protein At5g15710 [Cryptomeria japonica]GLJ22474.1 hypothetical protein SUGI_0423150 [Cryptomeria japonica]
MDNEVVRTQLPEDIMIRVFSLLPIYAIIRLQLVCKQWKNIISSKGFACLWSKISPPQLPLIIMYQSRDTIAAYDPSQAKWLTMGVTFPVGITHRRILASDGGLICYGSFCESNQLLIVCNPITKSWRILPELGFSKERFLIGMKADTSRNSYIVYVVENLNDLSSFDVVSIKEEIRVMVYDSLDDCWDTHCFNEVEVKCGCKRDRAVWVNGFLFALSLTGPPHGLSIYNAKLDKWSRSLLPFERSIPLSPSVLNCHGRLIIAAGAWEFLPFSSFDIWELDKESGKLLKLDSVRCAALEQNTVEPLPVDTVNRIGDGKVLFFHARGMPCPFVCDLGSSMWKTLPRYRGPCLSKLDALLFRPSLFAEV